MQRFRQGQAFDQNGITGTVLQAWPRFNLDGQFGAEEIGQTVTVVGRMKHADLFPAIYRVTFGLNDEGELRFCSLSFVMELDFETRVQLYAAMDAEDNPSEYRTGRGRE